MSSFKNYPRFILPRLKEALEDTPAVLIHGPRQCGKTTLALQLKKYSYFTFDDENLQKAVREDPVAFVDNLPKKVILDEVQKVPEIFSSLKYSIDRDRVAGRFLLTGSADLRLLPQVSESLAGRMEILHLFPLSQTEIIGQDSRFLNKIFEGQFKTRKTPRLKAELASLVVSGGFPEPFRRKKSVRKHRWYQNYIQAIIKKDIKEIAKISDVTPVAKVLRILANHSAQLLNVSEIAKAFQLSRVTIDSYISLLSQLFLVELLEPYHNNRNSRLVKTPKVHLSDTGLACSLLKINPEDLVQKVDVAGHLLESFVYNELRRQASWQEEEISFYHFRDRDGYEVDLVLEKGNNQKVGIEIKSAATIHEKDFKGLRRLKRLLGKSFTLGVLFYDGEHSLSFGESMVAIPLRQMWE